MNERCTSFDFHESLLVDVVVVGTTFLNVIARRLSLFDAIPFTISVWCLDQTKKDRYELIDR